MAEPALDDVFVDDITLPAMDGYPLGATLFLPRGAKRHAVLINSATAVPRNIYRGFAGYLARRGYTALTYDYRGTGDSPPRASRHALARCRGMDGGAGITIPSSSSRRTPGPPAVGMKQGDCHIT